MNPNLKPLFLSEKSIRITELNDEYVEIFISKVCSFCKLLTFFLSVCFPWFSFFTAWAGSVSSSVIQYVTICHHIYWTSLILL